VRSDRLLSLLLLLQTRERTTAEAMAGELGVSVRTIYRDVNALAEAGVPVLTERGPGGGLQLHPRYRTGLTGLSAREAEALFALSVPSLAHQFGLDQTLETARTKLVAAIPSERGRPPRRARERIHLDTAGWFRKPEEAEALRPLVEALWREQPVRLVHHGYETPSREARVDPLGLVLKGGAWYLVAAAEPGLRVYRVRRIESVEPLPGHVRPPAGFDLVAFWSRWTAEFEASRPRVAVTVLVAPDAVRSLRRVAEDWDEEAVARAEPEADGRLRLTVAFERLEYAAHELLALGAAVEVLEPAELRERIATAVREAAALYG